MRFCSAAKRSTLANANESPSATHSYNFGFCLPQRPGKKMNSLAIVRSPHFVSVAWRAKPTR
jgi:hypothetical protein